MSPALHIPCSAEMCSLGGGWPVSVGSFAVPLPGQTVLRQLLSMALVVLSADHPLAHSVPEVEAALRICDLWGVGRNLLGSWEPVRGCHLDWGGADGSGHLQLGLAHQSSSHQPHPGFLCFSVLQH